MADLTDTFYAAEGKPHGYGTQLLMGDGASPETFEAVAEVVVITPGEMTTATYDRTHLRSPLAHTEIEAALRSSGPFAISLNYRPKHESQNYTGGGSGSFTQGGLLKVWTTRETRNWKIVLADDSPVTEFPFSGFVSRYQIGEIGKDDGIALSGEIQPKNGAWHADLP